MMLAVERRQLFEPAFELGEVLLVVRDLPQLPLGHEPPLLQGGEPQEVIERAGVSSWGAPALSRSTNLSEYEFSS